MPQKVLNYFIAACDEPSAKNVKRALNSLKSWLAKRASDDEIADAIIHLVRENIAELTTELRTDVEAYRRFLPEPDKSTQNWPIWMLPNLSSFSNIYGRIVALNTSRTNGDFAREQTRTLLSPYPQNTHNPHGWPSTRANTREH